MSEEGSARESNLESEPAASAGESAGHVHQNIGDIVAFHEREHGKISPAQRRLEVVSKLIGRPVYLAWLLSAVALWIAANTVAFHRGVTAVDPPPFVWLTSFLTLAALVTTTVVLFAQNRQAKLENQRAHLDLQVNLLTEQKVTKLLHLLEELRRDLPMVKDRDDPVAAALQQPFDTTHVLAALESRTAIGDDGRPHTKPKV